MAEESPRPLKAGYVRFKLHMYNNDVRTIDVPVKWRTTFGPLTYGNHRTPYDSGSGTLAFRLYEGTKARAAYPGVIWFECEHPDLSTTYEEDPARVLQALGGKPQRANRILRGEGDPLNQYALAPGAVIDLNGHIS